MQRVTLGKTGLCVNKNGFGALPIQRVEMEGAVRILQKAYDSGVDYFDTARAYSDSEEKIGRALSHVRDKIVISTKTQAQDAAGFWADLEMSLRTLKTDYIDIYQFHNPAFCPVPGGADGLYDAACRAKEQGKIRHIGITKPPAGRRARGHRERAVRDAAVPAVVPFGGRGYRSGGRVPQRGHGLHRHEGACGRTDHELGVRLRVDGAAAVFARGAHLGHPARNELDEFLSYQDAPPALDEAMLRLIEADRAQLAGDFCRGCGYCMPCPAGIEINNCARMSLMLRRAPQAGWLSEEWQAKMKKIEDCLHCNQCRKKMPVRPRHPGAARQKLRGL